MSDLTSEFDNLPARDVISGDANFYRHYTEQGRTFTARPDGMVVVTTEGTGNPLDLFPSSGQSLLDIAKNWLAQWGQNGGQS